VQSPAVAQYYVPLPLLDIEPSGTLSPLLDLEVPLSSLSWAERVGWEEQEEASRATASADIPPEFLADGQGLAPMPRDPANLQPTL